MTHRKLERITVAALSALALLLGALQTWYTRYRMFSDGISYLDIAARYARGNWADAVNGYWSPLYSWILAVAVLLLHPGPNWQAATLHVVNFLAYVAGLAALWWFMQELLRRFPEVPRAVVLIGGYTSFLIAGLVLIGIGYCSPDLIAFCLFLSLSALILRLQSGPAPLWLYAAAGVLLGLNFLTRTAFAPLVLLYLAIIVVISRKRQKHWARYAGTVALLLLTAVPFVTALSVKQGRPSIGDSGKLNYGWEIAGASRSAHWQGEPGDLGRPLHPTTLVNKDPAVYVFDGPGTYSPWYDPSIWYAGLQPKFKFASQLTALSSNLSYTVILLAFSPLLIPSLLVVLISGQFGSWWGRFISLWPVVLPCLAGLALYCLVFVDKRYIAGFAFVIWMAALASIPFERLGSSRWAGAMEAFCILVLLVVIPLRFKEPARVAFNDLRHSSETEPNLNYLIAQRLQQLGLQPGDKVAYLGMGIDADWARLDHARIVAEIPVRFVRSWNFRGSSVSADGSELERFWQSDPATRQRILQLFRQAGAKFAITDGLFYPKDSTEWQPVLTPEQRKINFGAGQYTSQLESRFLRLVP